MKTLRGLLMIPVLASLLGGCVLVVPNDSDSSRGYWSHNDDSRSDRELAQAVRTRLDADNQIHAAAISVRNHNGVITLQGSMDDAAGLGKAVAIAATTPGVHKVISEITVLKQ